MEDKDVIYLDGGFFGSSYYSEKYTFLNKNSGLIYLKKEDNFYRQIDEDNPFVYELDNSVSELRDLKEVKWIYDIYSLSHDNGSEKVYQYVINKLSKFKKPKDNYLFEFKDSLAPIICINGGEAKFHLDEYLYVPKRIEDEELDYVKILVAKDEVFLEFTRFLSDGSYSVIYDNDFNVVIEGEINDFDDNVWNRLENYKKNDGKEMVKQWGFIRETSEIAERAGIDKATGIPRTGLDEYLSVIFPNTDDWVHDKTTGLIKENGKKSLSRPDYRSEQLKLIVEFDGLPHYQKPSDLQRDMANQELYESYGYKVVRVPYFIQLSNEVVEKLFGVKVKEPLFDDSIPSLSVEACNTPAFLCPVGIYRMARDFNISEKQYEVNVNYLKESDNLLTNLDLLEAAKEDIDKHGFRL
ncbi:DUF559 domain-containing protein [Ligilactobacillus aviarius]|uniref:DUF559 domain-containing protein n=1 Tax=Ligilactobacillus aviarius TaxID=1606 RepID=UPI001957C0B2|nr:DUF559 domain-containing protein [Ligilactobacillus aviarius]